MSSTIWFVQCVRNSMVPSDLLWTRLMSYLSYLFNKVCSWYQFSFRLPTYMSCVHIIDRRWNWFQLSCKNVPYVPKRQNDHIGRSHAHMHIINLRCICICVRIFARDCARCPIPKHSEGCRFQMAMLTSQFSAQRVGGAYLVITHEDLQNVQEWTQILKQLGL